MCDSLPKLQLNPSDSLDLTFALKKAMKLSGLSLAEIVEGLKQDYDVEITPSGLSHGINRGAIRFQRAVQILAICGVSEVEIKGAKKGR